eukprot:PhM_4_TR19089/c0_g1_i1/m.96446
MSTRSRRYSREHLYTIDDDDYDEEQCEMVSSRQQQQSPADEKSLYDTHNHSHHKNHNKNNTISPLTSVNAIQSITFPRYMRVSAASRSSYHPVQGYSSVRQSIEEHLSMEKISSWVWFDINVPPNGDENKENEHLFQMCSELFSIPREVLEEHHETLRMSDLPGGEIPSPLQAIHQFRSNTNFSSSVSLFSTCCFDIFSPDFQSDHKSSARAMHVIDFILLDEAQLLLTLHMSTAGSASARTIFLQDVLARVSRTSGVGDVVCHAFAGAIETLHAGVQSLLCAVDSSDEIVFVLGAASPDTPSTNNVILHDRAGMLRRVSVHRREHVLFRRDVLHKEDTLRRLHMTTSLASTLKSELGVLSRRLDAARECISQVDSNMFALLASTSEHHANTTTHHMKRLTVLHFVLTPLMVTTGLFGMNVTMPDQATTTSSSTSTFTIMVLAAGLYIVLVCCCFVSGWAVSASSSDNRNNSNTLINENVSPHHNHPPVVLSK